MRMQCPSFSTGGSGSRLLSLLFLLLLTLPVQGQLGTEISSVAVCGSNASASDVALNTSDNTIWSIDSSSGKICVFSYSSTQQSMFLANMIDHPVGAALAPLFQPQCTGITYNPDSDTFWILNGTSLELVEMDTSGNQVGTAVPFSMSGNAVGLTYDTLSNTLWTRDTFNQVAVELDLVTGAIVSTLPLPGDTNRYGSGLSFRQSPTSQGYLDFTYGTAFDAQVSEIRSISTSTGSLECDLVPFDGTLPQPILGLTSGPEQDQVLTVTPTMLVLLDSMQPAIHAPADLVCTADGEGAIDLSWRNCGPGGGGLYTLIRITRNGAIVDTLPGSATSWQDLTPAVDTTHEYQVQGVVGSIIGSSSCSVLHGPGGLVSWAPFTGDRPRDLAYDEQLDDLYVTESFSGVIQVFDSELNLKRTIDTGLTNLRGIGYNPTVGLLLVSRANNGLVTFVDPMTGSPLSSFPSNSTDVSAITYDSLEDDWLLLDEASSPATIRRMEALEGFEGNPLGTITPPSTSGLSLGGGLASVPEGSIFCGVENQGQITSASQFTAFGFPLNFSLPFSAMGNSPLLLNNAITGIELVGSSLVVAGQATDTLFKLLVVSDGPDFIRGDSDSSGTVNLTDVIFTATWIYADGAEPDCQDACDANDDGRIDISDPIYTLFYLFTASAAPPAPFPSPGPDPTFLDEIGC